MKLWYNINFKGFWPVGTAAIVKAETPEKAAELLNEELEKSLLEPSAEAKYFKELDMKDNSVLILLDGNY